MLGLRGGQQLTVSLGARALHLLKPVLGRLVHAAAQLRRQRTARDRLVQLLHVAVVHKLNLRAYACAWREGHTVRTTAARAARTRALMASGTNGFVSDQNVSMKSGAPSM